MTPRLPALLDPEHFSEAELSALLLDGEIYRVGDRASPLDEIPSVVNRAGVLAAVLPRQLIVERASAAWIWGSLHRAPARHQVCADGRARSRPAHSASVEVREVVIGPSEISVVNGLAVTTPLRTTIDLARWSSIWSSELSHAAAALMVLGKFDSRECARIMNQRRNLPNKVVALERLIESETIAETLGSRSS